VLRFLGTSADSSNVFSLLQSLCQQLYIISNGKETFMKGSSGPSTGQSPFFNNSFDSVLKYFITSLKELSSGRLALFLDSVDQLDDTNSGRSLKWLPLVGLSNNVQLVASTLPDEPHPEVGRPFRCLSALVKGLIPDHKWGHDGQPEQEQVLDVCKSHADLFVMVEPLKGAASLLTKMLRFAGRRVTKLQMDAVISALNGSEQAQTPLMMTVLAETMKSWTSFIPQTAVPASVKEIIAAFFFRMELIHGVKLTSHTVAYLTILLQGVSEMELLDILSIDDSALAEAYPWYSECCQQIL
jgi:hypothetical protein